MKTRDCRIPNGNTETYSVVVDGEKTLQNVMFNRGDMSFWGFSAADVTPPEGKSLHFWPNGEPYFE